MTAVAQIVDTPFNEYMRLKQRGYYHNGDGRAKRQLTYYMSKYGDVIPDHIKNIENLHDRLVSIKQFISQRKSEKWKSQYKL